MLRIFNQKRLCSEDLERFYFQYQADVLLARKAFSLQPIGYSGDMPADEKDRYIHYLVDKVNELTLDKRAMELGVEEFQATFDSVNASLAELRKEMEELKGDNISMRKELRDERNKRKQAEARVCKLDQQLKFAQKNRFGDKRQKARKSVP